ncbi:MAG: YfhO family protein [Anaerolineae bacterium]|nr:YfhO family protein [Anaerolineae bacterium]
MSRKRDKSGGPVWIAPFAARSAPLLPFILLPLLLLWRPLFAGESLFWGTPLLQFVPWQRLAAEMWRSGHLPLWNPLAGCGAPLAANYQTGAFYPLYGLALLIPADVALGWTVALHLALTGLGMYAWARAAGLDPFPALVAGLALEGCGFLVARAGLFPSIAVTFPWIPIWLWRAERLVRAGRLRDTLWLGLALGLGLLAGHAQTAAYGLLLLAAYVACRLSPTAARRRLPLALLALALGLALAAAQILPTAELLRFSQRAAGVEREAGLVYSFWPWRLLTLAAPDLFGNPARGGYWGYGNYWEDAAYVGLLPLLLAATALSVLRRRTPWRRMAGFWAVVLGGGFFLALGRHNPLFLWLFDHVPGLDAFQAPSRWLALVELALAALAGLGAQQWRRGPGDRKRGTLGLVVGAAAVLGGLAAPHVAPGIRASFGWATVRLGITLAAVGALLLARRDTAGWRAAAVGLLLLDLLVFGWGLAPSVERALYQGRSATAAQLEAAENAPRVFWPPAGRPEAGYDLKFSRYFRFDSFGPPNLDFWWSLREAQLPNVGMLDGIASANNFDPLLVSWAAEAAQAADRAPHLLPALGVTHLVTAAMDAEVHVTALPQALGRAWIVPAARQLPAADVLAALSDPGFDPADSVLVQAAAAGRLPAAPAADPPAASSITLHDAPNRVTIDVVLDQPGYLVLADTWYPGWQASVDGEEAALLRANHAFRALFLPAGQSAVEMTYRPATVRAGGWISLGAVLLLAGLFAVRGRGKPRPLPPGGDE